MDQQTPGTQSETGSAPQQAYTPMYHSTPIPAPGGQPDLAKRAIAVVIDGVIAAVIYTVLSRVFGMALGGGLVAWMVGNFVGSAAAGAFYLARDVAYHTKFLDYLFTSFTLIPTFNRRWGVCTGKSFPRSSNPSRISSLG